MAALIICVITYFAGFFTSSVVILDSRLQSANDEIDSLKETVKTKDEEIDSLNDVIDQKNESNIILAETVADHLETIDSLNTRIESLESDVDYVSEVALNGGGLVGVSLLSTFSLLTTNQQLILLVLLFVIVLFIVSITCGVIAAKNAGKKKAKAAPVNEDEAVIESSDETEETEEASENEALEEAPASGSSDPTPEFGYPEKVDDAIDLLYHQNLEDSISDLGGFRFGITNFDDILSDKAKGKSFGNSDNGDFVAFMDSKSNSKKLYIIPRHMALSDSTVALRGVTDLFNVTDEGGNAVTHGTVKIKTVDAPAVFAFGERGWYIETKGAITSYGSISI